MTTPVQYIRVEIQQNNVCFDNIVEVGSKGIDWDDAIISAFISDKSVHYIQIKSGIDGYVMGMTKVGAV